MKENVEVEISNDTYDRLTKGTRFQREMNCLKMQFDSSMEMLETMLTGIPKYKHERARLAMRKHVLDEMTANEHRIFDDETVRLFIESVS